VERSTVGQAQAVLQGLDARGKPWLLGQIQTKLLQPQGLLAKVEVLPDVGILRKCEATPPPRHRQLLFSLRYQAPSWRQHHQLQPQLVRLRLPSHSPCHYLCPHPSTGVAACRPIGVLISVCKYITGNYMFVNMTRFSLKGRGGINIVMFICLTGHKNVDVSGTVTC